jgi:hypothetical protein
MPIEHVAVESLRRIEEICAALPECTVEGDQHHTLRVRGKTIAWHTVDHHGDGRVALQVRAARGENDALAAAEPDRYYLPPYVAHHGYVGVYLDTGDVDWDAVRDLIVDGYRIVAPKRLVQQLPP